MVQAVESGERENLAARQRAHCCRPTFWRILRESEVSPIFMVVTNIVEKQPLEVLLIQYDHVVQQISSATPDPALCHTVLPRAAKAVRVGWLPKSLTSNTRNLCAGTYGHASRNCCAIQRAFGFRVTLKRRIFRRSWPITKKQYRTPNVSVGTLKKSIAAMASRWFRRNVSHRLAGFGVLKADHPLCAELFDNQGYKVEDPSRCNSKRIRIPR
jgi:hypothetical protein